MNLLQISESKFLCMESIWQAFPKASLDWDIGELERYCWSSLADARQGFIILVHDGINLIND